MPTKQLTEQMLSFWNRPDVEEAKKVISSPEMWEEEIPVHLDLILNQDPVVREYVNTLRFMSAPTKALEIGCGIGRLLKPMTQHFHEVLGVDISENMLAYSKKYLEGVECVETRLVKEDNELGLTPDSLDFVYSIIVFQHIPTRAIIKSYLKQIHDGLKSGGLFRVQTHRGLPPPEGAFCGFSGYMYRDLQTFANEIEEAGFKIETRQEKLGHVEWLWVTARKP
jgi:SAM-dependent methyltransferase